jgi:hypothetical protein
MVTGVGRHGLSKKTNLQGDVAKPGAVKIPGGGSIAKNHRPVGNGGGATHSEPGGKNRKTHTDGSTAKGWKGGTKP